MPLTKSKTRPRLSAPTRSWQFETIGTHWWIGIFEPISEARFKRLQTAVHDRIEYFDKTYSRFRADSLVTEMSKNAGRYEFPDDCVQLLNFYRQLYNLTDGAVTPLIGDVLSSAGYDANYSMKPGPMSKPPAWDEVLSHRGTELSVKQPAMLDFGAAGKGYLVDLLGEVLASFGVEYFCIDAGGDMIVHNDVPLKVGLEHPDDASLVIGVAELQDRALCGSAGNRRAWAEFHHIMSPFTLRPVRKIKAAWAVADNALTADGLTTALFFVPPLTLRQFSFEYLLIDENNRLAYSPGFPAEIFSR